MVGRHRPSLMIEPVLGTIASTAGCRSSSSSSSSNRAAEAATEPPRTMVVSNSRLERIQRSLASETPADRVVESAHRHRAPTPFRN